MFAVTSSTPIGITQIEGDNSSHEPMSNDMAKYPTTL